MFWSWFQATRKTDKARMNSYRPRLEGLEARTLPTVNPLTFNIDPTQSSLAVAASLGSTQLQPQGTGSLTTTYHGTIATSYDQDFGTLQFNAAGTNVVANNSGSWQPLPGGGTGSAPANYGGQGTIIIFAAKVAVRGFAANIVTASTVNVDSAGHFPSNQTFTSTAGSADYNAGGAGSGTADISGLSAMNAAGNGTIVSTGSDTYQLTVPIDVTIHQTVQGMQATLHVTGNIRGAAQAQFPIINLNGYSGALDTTQGNTSVGVTDGNATITSNGSQTLNQLVVTAYSIPDDPSENLSADTSVNPNLTASYDSSSGYGILTISGTGSISDYQTVLNTITYNNTTVGNTGNPATAGDRFFAFQVTDDQGLSNYFVYSDVNVT